MPGTIFKVATCGHIPNQLACFFDLIMVDLCTVLLPIPCCHKHLVTKHRLKDRQALKALKAVGSLEFYNSQFSPFVKQLEKIQSLITWSIIISVTFFAICCNFKFHLNHDIPGIIEMPKTYPFVPLLTAPKITIRVSALVHFWWCTMQAHMRRDQLWACSFCPFGRYRPMLRFFDLEA